MSLLKVLFGSRPNTDKVQVVSREAYAQGIEKGKVQLVDVRTSREFNAGHIKGAKNFDFFNPSQFKKGVATLDKSKPVYLYCQSGNRSRKAANRLLTMGFNQIIDLAGGTTPGRVRLIIVSL